MLGRTRSLQRLLGTAARSRFGTHSSSAHARWNPRKTIWRAGALTTGVLSSALLFVAAKPLYADADADNATIDPASARKQPLSAVVRSYFVYTACAIPALVDYSPAILSTCLSVPVLRDVTEAVLKRTFFAQFVGGYTAEDALPLLVELRRQNKAALLSYSVEVDEKAAGKGKSPPYMQNVDEMIHSIDVAADFEDSLAKGSTSSHGRKTWVAVKLSALLPDSAALIKLSTLLLKQRAINKEIAFPGCPSPCDLTFLCQQSSQPGLLLSTSEIHDLKQLHDNLIRICTRAKERGVKILVDAEHSWYQPAIDAYTLSLMRTFNKLPSASKSYRSIFGRTAPSPDTQADVQPLVYATFQSYLRRAYPYLQQSLANARAGNYALGIKLVRGAYHSQEIASHHKHRSGGKSPSISPDAEPPVFLSKEETDRCYNDCVRLLVGLVKEDIEKGDPAHPPTLGLLFGSHNADSCNLVLDELARAGLAEPRDGVLHIPDAVAERVTVAQLYGMRDSLSNALVERTRSGIPLVMKYVPYGRLSEVMPYLSRRAKENKTVLGGSDGAAAERREAWLEIKKRVFG